MGAITVEHLLFVGGSGYVVALDKRNGHEVWRCNLKNTGWNPVQLQVDWNAALGHPVLIVGTQGKLFSVDVRTGKVVWKNGLKGMGYGPVSMSFISGDNPSNYASNNFHRLK